MSRVQQILVVDDDGSLRAILRLTLECEGYAVIEASDGDGALELARQKCPDLILLDIGMPTRDGWAVLAELRTDPSLSDIPVVMLTGEADESTEWRAREMGALQYITKPVDVEDVLSTVVGLLGRPPS